MVKILAITKYHYDVTTEVSPSGIQDVTSGMIWWGDLQAKLWQDTYFDKGYRKYKANVKSLDDNNNIIKRRNNRVCRLELQYI